MTLLEQAVAFRTAFNQEMLEGMVRYGFIKEKLFDMQAGLIAEEANEFLEACADLKKDPHKPENHIEVLKEASDIVFVSGFQQLGVQGVLSLHHYAKDDSGNRRCADHYTLDGPRSCEYCCHHLLDLFLSNRCQHYSRVTIGRQRSRRII